MRVLVTGSSGFIGSRVVKLLEKQGHQVLPFDYPRDVLNPDDFILRGASLCEAAIHLAADKHAGNGEEYPHRVARVNIEGTHNVVRAVPKVILASTCKAADAVTCYGASKLIAERIVLNAGGTVVRFVNVLGSTGSVTDVWDAIPADQPLPVTNTYRMFMEPDQAASLLVRALDLPPGRYGPNVRRPEWMPNVAERLHPDRAWQWAPLRRGDRPVERLANEYEHVRRIDSELVQIVDCWERPVAAVPSEVAA